ncbi:metalloprotease family protein (plasmid) [Clostridium perfringens]
MGLLKIFIEPLFIFAYLSIFFILGGIVLDKIQMKSNQYLYNGLGYIGYILTGLGTIVHELSHLLFVVLFGMKPTDVKLLRPIAAYRDGKLGYVKYSYNKNSLFHKVGLIFVGVAPIIGGTIAMIVLTKIFMPQLYSTLIGNVNSLANTSGSFNISIFMDLLDFVISFIYSMFSDFNISSLKSWAYLFLIFSISSHMSLSMADIRGSLSGVPTVYLLFFLLNLLLIATGESIIDYTYIVTKINVFVVTFMSISIIFSTVSLILSFIFSNIVSKK